MEVHHQKPSHIQIFINMFRGPIANSAIKKTSSLQSNNSLKLIKTSQNNSSNSQYSETYSSSYSASSHSPKSMSKIVPDQSYIKSNNNSNTYNLRSHVPRHIQKSGGFPTAQKRPAAAVFPDRPLRQVNNAYSTRSTTQTLRTLSTGGQSTIIRKLSSATTSGHISYQDKTSSSSSHATSDPGMTDEASGNSSSDESSNTGTDDKGTAFSSTSAKPSSTGVLCCDKCDGKHLTDDCPYYKKSRESHPDAQKSSKSLGGQSTLPGIDYVYTKN